MNSFQKYDLIDSFTIRRTSSKKLSDDDVRRSSDEGNRAIVGFSIELATVGRVDDVGLGGS